MGFYSFIILQSTKAFCFCFGCADGCNLSPSIVWEHFLSGMFPFPFQTCNEPFLQSALVPFHAESLFRNHALGITCSLSIGAAAVSTSLLTRQGNTLKTSRVRTYTFNTRFKLICFYLISLIFKICIVFLS